jgi:hypothetical protein
VLIIWLAFLIRACVRAPPTDFTGRGLPLDAFAMFNDRWKRGVRSLIQLTPVGPNLFGQLRLVE